MKCIHCGADSKYKDRVGGRCPGCKRLFAFEPKSGGIVTDMAFKSALDAVSSNGRVRWGLDNLYFEVCRRKRTKLAGLGQSLGCAAVATVAAVLCGIGPGEAWFLAPAWIAVMLFLAFQNRLVTKTVPVTRASFDVMWVRWLAVHGGHPGLIVRSTTPARKRQVEPDLADYSFDRAVICDRPETVDLLLANNFHFENNCAVLSITGYPEGPFETVRSMLKRNPRLQVFALHDASAAGCRLAYRLSHDAAWFKGHVGVTDVGLRPSHAGPFVGLLVPATAAVAPGQGIEPGEAEWLSKYTLELAAVRPEQVLKRLFRAVNRRELQSGSDGGTSGGDGGGYAVDAYSFSSDAGDSDGGPDGFG